MCIILTIRKCLAEEENPLFSSTDLYDLSVFSDFSSLTDPEDLEGSLQTDPTDLIFPPTLAFLDSDDETNAFSNFADSNEVCPFETSQLTSIISRRGGVDACDNSEGSSSLNAPTIDPKVAPFVDIGTMELKTICPRQDKSPYSIAVCSSGIKWDIIIYPPDVDFDLLWAQKSKLRLFYVFEIWT